MSSTTVGGNALVHSSSVNWHRRRLRTCALIGALLIVGVGAYGLDYYGLALADRAMSPKHSILRPSGTIGLRLGIFGVFLFLCLYMYPLRKKWKRLGRVGNTRHWLDFHVLFGITAPLVVTLHSSFKFQGVAGAAYWLMIAVMASGVVGRYIYAKIPRSLNSAELSLADMELTAEALTEQLEKQPALSARDIEATFRLPDVDQVRRRSILRVLLMMFWLDLSGGWRASRLRRSGMRFGECLRTLGGLARSRNEELEAALRLVRQRARVQTRIVFLDRTHQMFHLWHVVHRPFSYAFATLAIVHVVFMIMLGYY